jgi:hypothetical protein
MIGVEMRDEDVRRVPSQELTLADIKEEAIVDQHTRMTRVSPSTCAHVASGPQDLNAHDDSRSCLPPEPR